MAASLSQLADAQETTPSDTCGGPGWRRVAFVNMSDPNQACPQGLNETDYSIRSCGRPDSEPGPLCLSATFPVNEEYSQVCGRVMAYRWGWNSAFHGYHRRNISLESYFVDGVILTHGSPRTHIWTFASGLWNQTSDDEGYDLFAPNFCPCDESSTFGSPPFVGDDYFCESVATVENWDNANRFRLYTENALWDGEGCQGNMNTCCLFNNPPWFTRTLPTPTCDDIELRLCLWEDDDRSDIAIELLELYVGYES